jgi:hypothetical protein
VITRRANRNGTLRVQVQQKVGNHWMLLDGEDNVTGEFDPKEFLKSRL